MIVPEQLFTREPADALHESTLHLAAIDHRSDRVTDVLEDVGAKQAVGAGEPVDFDFRDGGGIDEVVKGFANASR